MIQALLTQYDPSAQHQRAEASVTAKYEANPGPIPMAGFDIDISMPLDPKELDERYADARAFQCS